MRHLILLVTISMVIVACADSTSSPHRAESASPSEASKALVRPDGFDLQGHRGARGLMPENTIPAFRRALEVGVTTLEMDVVISADSQVVVSHDPWMSSTICSLPSGRPVPAGRGRDYRIFEMTYDEVKQFDCGSRGHPRFPRQKKVAARKPLLREVIQRAEAYTAKHDRPPVFYNIETKAQPEWDGTFHPDPETFTRLLVDVLVETDVVGRVIIQSFGVRTLQVAREMDEPMRLALLVARGEDRGIEENLQTLGFTPDIYSPDYHLVDAALIEQAHKRGMAVIPWTVNSLEEMRRLQRLGVDGLITDYPDVGVQLLE